MPNQTHAALARNWAILAALILQIGRVLTPAVRLSQGTRNHLCHLLRLAESLARRWLLLKARLCPLTTPPARAATRRNAKTLGIARCQAAALLQLLEPDPVLRASDFSLQPFASDAQNPPVSPDLETPADAAYPGAALLRRAQALRDVLQRPQIHTARMARWLTRAADKARNAFVRMHPLRVSRPPGARRDRTCPHQAALWWLDTLARDSLLPGWEP